MNRNKRKCKAQYTSSTHNRGYNGLKIAVGEYQLEVSRTGTVYWTNTAGRRRLDSLMHKKTGTLSVSLPDGKEVELMNTPEGLKVK